MKTKLMFSSLVLLALVVSACSSATPPASPAVATQTSAPVIPVSGGEATVNVSQDATLGPILVDSSGATLYIYLNDSTGQSNCTGTCASNWPPLLTTGAPVAGDGVTASLLGTTTRSDGSVQVTYAGHPLYHYSGDMAAGDTNGEGVGGIWYVISPDGTQK